MTRPERLVLSVPEAALMLGISRTLGYELVARGELPSLRLGGRIVIPRRQLQLLLDGSAPDADAALLPAAEAGPPHPRS